MHPRNGILRNFYEQKDSFYTPWVNSHVSSYFDKTKQMVFFLKYDHKSALTFRLFLESELIFGILLYGFVLLFMLFDYHPINMPTILIGKF